MYVCAPAIRFNGILFDPSCECMSVRIFLAFQTESRQWIYYVWFSFFPWIFYNNNKISPLIITFNSFIFAVGFPPFNVFFSPTIFRNYSQLFILDFILSISTIHCYKRLLTLSLYVPFKWNGRERQKKKKLLFIDTHTHYFHSIVLF